MIIESLSSAFYCSTPILTLCQFLYSPHLFVNHLSSLQHTLPPPDLSMFGCLYPTCNDVLLPPLFPLSPLTPPHFASNCSCQFGQIAKTPAIGFEKSRTGIFKRKKKNTVKSKTPIIDDPHEKFPEGTKI